MTDILNSYNTTRPQLILKEYGRNIQKLVDYICKIEDREQRNRYAHTLVELMRQINPSIKEANEYTQKLWDDLYIMSGYSLEVDSPYPMPEKELLGKKPKKVEYSRQPVQFKHYGKNVEKLINKALEAEDPEERKAGIIYVGRLMKNFYGVWNKENVDNEVILQNMEEISGQKIEDVDIQEIKEKNLFDPAFPRQKNKTNRKNYSNNTGNKRKRNT